MRAIVKYGVGGNGHFGGVRGGLASVQIAVETREIAARNFQAKTMAGAEQVAGGQQIDGERIDLAGNERRGRFLGATITGAKNAFGDVYGRTIGKDIDKFGGEISIHGGGRSEEVELDRAGHFDVVLEGCGGKD